MINYLNVYKNMIKDKFRRKLFSRINKVELTKHGDIKKIAGKSFSRGVYNYDPSLLLKREISFLKKLKGNHFPKIKEIGNNWMILSYCGQKISKYNIPKNWKKQISDICDELNEHNIIHRDIKQGNVLVHNDIIYLIDFGWAVFEQEEFYICPRELDVTISKELIYDNKKAFQWLVSSYER